MIDFFLFAKRCGDSDLEFVCVGATGACYNSLAYYLVHVLVLVLVLLPFLFRLFQRQCGSRSDIDLTIGSRLAIIRGKAAVLLLKREHIHIFLCAKGRHW